MYLTHRPQRRLQWGYLREWSRRSALLEYLLHTLGKKKRKEGYLVFITRHRRYKRSRHSQGMMTFPFEGAQQTHNKIKTKVKLGVKHLMSCAPWWLLVWRSQSLDLLIGNLCTSQREVSPLSPGVFLYPLVRLTLLPSDRHSARPGLWSFSFNAFKSMYKKRDP